MTLQFPTQVPSEFLPSFIRGYFDRDGCVYEGFTSKNSLTSSVQVHIVSTSDMIWGISKWAEEKVGQIDYKPSVHPNGETLIFNLGTKQALKFLEEIYKDSSPETRLDRKYEKSSKLLAGDRKTRELVPYDQRMPTKTSRRRKKRIMV